MFPRTGRILPLLGARAISGAVQVADFEQAKREIAANPTLGALWGQRFAGLPPGFLNLCQQTIDLSKEKVEKWLATRCRRSWPVRFPASMRARLQNMACD